MTPETPRNNAAKTRGKPFPKGNPGRPKGARHRATQAAEALLDGEAEALTRKAVELALGGDGAALRLCLERILPPRKGRAVALDLPPIRGAADLADAQAVIVAAMADGALSPVEALEAAAVLEAVGASLERRDLEARLAALEARGEAKA